MASEDERAFAEDKKEGEVLPGHRGAKYRLALLLLDGKDGLERDPKRAASLLESCAIEGEHPEAYYQLALCYLNGCGVERNPARGFELLHTAAVKDVAIAQYLCGRMRFLGEEGMEADPVLARSFLLRAAHQGINSSHYFLGQICQYGLGMEKDMAGAIEHYEAGAEGGDASCLFELAALDLTGEEEGIIEEDHRTAFELFREAAELGHAEVRYETKKSKLSSSLTQCLSLQRPQVRLG